MVLSSFWEKNASTVRPAQKSGYERESIAQNERNVRDAQTSKERAEDERKLRLCRASTSNIPSLVLGFYLALNYRKWNLRE